MNIKDKISCITITHNRVDMLKRSIKCFEEQTYNNKELVILFTGEDEETSQFAEANKHCRFIQLKQRDTSRNVIIESVADVNKHLSEFKDTEEIYLRKTDGGFISAKIDGTITESEQCGQQEKFILENHGETVSVKTSHGTWLNIKTDGKFKQASVPNATEFKTSILLDNKILLKSAQQISGKTEIDILGWDTEIINNVSSQIVFVQIHPYDYISLGSKRNLAIKTTSGEYICVWDDDDWYDKNRLTYQLGYLQFMKKSACTIANTILFDHNTGQGYINSPRLDGWEQTILCRKSEMCHYGNLNRGEDTPVLKKFYKENKVCVIEEPQLYIYNVHTGNTCSNSHFMNMINNVQTVKLDEKENNYVKFNLGMLSVNGNN